MYPIQMPVFDFTGKTAIVTGADSGTTLIADGGATTGG